MKSKDTGCPKVINVRTARANLESLIERALAGDEVILGLKGKPVGRIVPYDVKLEPPGPESVKAKG